MNMTSHVLLGGSFAIKALLPHRKPSDLDVATCLSEDSLQSYIENDPDLQEYSVNVSSRYRKFPKSLLDNCRSQLRPDTVCPEVEIAWKSYAGRNKDHLDILAIAETSQQQIEFSRAHHLYRKLKRKVPWEIRELLSAFRSAGTSSQVPYLPIVEGYPRIREGLRRLMGKGMSVLAIKFRLSSPVSFAGEIIWGHSSKLKTKRLFEDLEQQVGSSWTRSAISLIQSHRSHRDFRGCNCWDTESVFSAEERAYFILMTHLADRRSSESEFRALPILWSKRLVAANPFLILHNHIDGVKETVVRGSAGFLTNRLAKRWASGEVFDWPYIVWPLGNEHLSEIESLLGHFGHVRRVQRPTTALSDEFVLNAYQSCDVSDIRLGLKRDLLSQTSGQVAVFYVRHNNSLRRRRVEDGQELDLIPMRAKALVRETLSSKLDSYVFDNLIHSPDNELQAIALTSYLDGLP